MTFDVRDEKADEMMLLNATLIALHASCGNARGVDRAVSYLESVGIARAEAEEVGTINFKALQEGILSAELSHLTQFLSVYLPSEPCLVLNIAQLQHISPRNKKMGAFPLTG
jgi:hypothetical protein